MCEPTSLAVASLASLAAGSGLQIAGQRQAQHAERDAAAAERIRQRGYQQQQMATLDEATAETSRPTFDAAADRASGDRAAALRAVSEPQTGYLPGQGTGPQIVRDEVDRRRAAAAAFTGQQAGARAKLGGWQDAIFGTHTAIARAGQRAGMLGGFAQGSASLLESDRAGAATRGGGLRTAGDMFAIAGRHAPDIWREAGDIFGGGPKGPAPAAPATTGRYPGPI